LGLKWGINWSAETENVEVRKVMVMLFSEDYLRIIIRG